MNQSNGVKSYIPGNTNKAEENMDFADKVLYIAKNYGRNRFMSNKKAKLRNKELRFLFFLNFFDFKHCDSNKRKCDKCKRRNSDETKPVNVLTRAWNTASTNLNFFHKWHLLYAVMIDRYYHSNNRQWHNIFIYILIMIKNRHPKDNH